MKKVAIIVFAFALLGAASAQTVAGEASSPREDFRVLANNVRVLAENLRTNSTLSYSGQFVIFTSQPAMLARPLPRSLATNANFIALEPTLLAVSCERIKQALWRELDAPVYWHGKIYLDLVPLQFASGPVISSQIMGGERDYRVELPNVVERSCLVRTIVQVLLLDAANRNAGGHLAEIPAWLAEGLAQQLLGASEIELLPPPPRLKVNGLAINPQMVEERKPNPLARAQAQLRAQPALTFEELSWPAEEQMSAAAQNVFRASAQLFVNQLLQWTNGPACLRAMLGELPEHYNWQLAFLSGFHSHFQTALDVEKWWALQVAQFTARDLIQTWTQEESWKKLDEILHPPVQIRTEAGELPSRNTVSLQSIIREWDGARQAQVLARELHELTLLRLRVAPGLWSLVDDYYQALESYLRKRDSSDSTIQFGKQTNPIPNRFAEETLKQLNALDTRREALRPSPQNPVATAAETIPAVTH